MKKDYIREYVTIGGMLLGLVAMILGKMSFTELMVFSICLNVIDIKKTTFLKKLIIGCPPGIRTQTTPSEGITVLETGVLPLNERALLRRK